jgi:hypothetical protein
VVKVSDTPVPRPVAALLALILLGSCSAHPPPAAAVPDSGKVTRIPVPDLDLPRRMQGGAVLEEAWTLRSRLRISGLSAMALQGDRLMLATDDGQLFATNCPEDQTLQGCDDRWGYDGRLVARGAPRADLEALAIRPDGSVVAGLENMPRLALLQPDGSGYQIAKLPGAPNMRSLPKNSGPEAVASLPDGRLVVLPEGSVTQEGQATILVEQPDGSWQTTRMLLPTPGLLPTEAAVAGDRLFVLLRGLGLLAGWQMQIVALPLASLDARPDELPEPVLVVTLDEQRIADNYEAMAVRQMADGSYTLLVASDDNGFTLQQKLLLLFSWREEGA